MDNYLAHVGVGHDRGGHSGRYPYGSGKDPYQHSRDFMTSYRKMKSEGLSNADIAAAKGISQNELRKEISYHTNAEKMYYIPKVIELQKTGLYSNSEIGRMLRPDDPIPEGTIRGWIKNDQFSKSSATRNTANVIKDEIDKKGIIDVGKGVEIELGVNSTHFNNALKVLENEGYEIHDIFIPNSMDPTKKTTIKVIAKSPVDWVEVNKNPGMIQSMATYIEDEGLGPTRILQYPESFDSKRLQIVYADEGGLDKDGIIELRRGVEDISLGDVNYAQVRIAVDDNLYMKGMAIYSDDLPDGVDIRFNSNKESGTPLEKVLKPMKKLDDGSIDVNNPFGATIKANGQNYYEKEDGKFVKIKTSNGSEQYILDDGTYKNDIHYGMSVSNKIKSEEDWESYSKNLASQFLSKQKKELIDKQLQLTIDDKKAQYDDILSIANPAVRKYMLNEFADSCDKDAVDLKAMALPRQTSKVLLPVYDIPDGQCYCPTFQNGEKVYLVRYPHGSTHEIPELTVNNNWKTGIDVIGPHSIDAIGINKKTANQLSGADFDGDSVVVIPANSKYRITADKAFKELENFSTDEYKIPDTPDGKKIKRLDDDHKGREMGVVSNLITDMTLRGAPDEDMVKAIKHSMVVIDAPKHDLDYKRSEKENDIELLKKRYQPNPTSNKGYGGASTLISKAKSQTYIPKVKRTTIDPETGEKILIPSNEMKRVYTNKTETKIVYNSKGEPVEKTYKIPKKDANGNDIYEPVMQKSTQMADTKDARTLSSGHPKEEAYAAYANQMKSFANQARKEMISTTGYKVDQSAKETYANEVASLTAKLNTAVKSHPKERQVQIIAQQEYLIAKANNPNLSKEEAKKIREQTTATARARLGSKKDKVVITDREWEAIQAHALGMTTVTEILKNTDSKQLKQLALPKERKTISIAQQNKIKSMENSGFTLEEIATSIGVSPSTINSVLKGTYGKE